MSVWKARSSAEKLLNHRKPACLKRVNEIGQLLMASPERWSDRADHPSQYGSDQYCFARTLQAGFSASAAFRPRVVEWQLPRERLQQIANRSTVQNLLKRKRNICHTCFCFRRASTASGNDHIGGRWKNYYNR